MKLRVVRALGMRSIRQTFRRPQLIAPIVLFPTLMLAFQTGGAGSAINLPGFPPVQSFLQFMLAGATMQALMIAGNSGGIAMAVDIEMGFIDRLFVAPISRYAVIFGRLAGTAVLGLIAGAWFIVVGVVFGVHFEGGILGILLALALVTATATAIGAIAASIALWTGTASIVQGLFPLIFVGLFLSTAFFPKSLMAEPAQTIAAFNPLSFIVNGVREPFISHLTATVALEAIAAVALIFALGLWMSASALRHRLRTGV